MILINGVQAEYVSLHDRGVHYGDGLFETVEVYSGRPVFLKQHLQRLVEGCQRLKIPAPELTTLKNEIDRLCQGTDQTVLKIIVTRGQGGRGYRQPEIIEPTRIVGLYPKPNIPDAFAKEGINARFCETRLGLNPDLAGIKHLNRLEQVLARAEWTDTGIQEGIMLDWQDNIIEGTMTNLFYVKAGILYTASLQKSGVAGIIRGIIIQLAKEHAFPVCEHHFGKVELLSAEEAFVCNSIIGIFPIKQLEDRRFTIGKSVRQMQSWLADFKSKDLKCWENT